MHRVIFIGAGPGDPGLLTLRGAERLAGCRAVFAPRPYEETFAHLLAGKRVLVPFDFSFDELWSMIESLRQEGDVAFLVPGDITFYSPFQAFINKLGSSAEVIPGVGSVNAAAAALKRTLNLSVACDRTIISSPRILGEKEGSPALRDLAGPGTTLILYMNDLPLPELAAELRIGFGTNVPIAIFHRLGLPGEGVVAGTLDDIAEKAGEGDFFPSDGSVKSRHLTLVIAGDALTAQADEAWWDRRREEVWKHQED